MDNIDFVEHGGGVFHVRHNGELVSLPDPRTQHYQWVLMCLSLSHVPGIPDGVPEWKRQHTFERWCAAWDLPDFASARRLAYLVDNYRAAISHDLSVNTHFDLGELWRSRRWTLLLDVLDRLPAHSWYASSVAMDEDHAKMIAESLAAREPTAAEDRGPALTTWTPEVAALTNVLDAVRAVQYAVIAVQHGKKAGEPPKPAPRPVTPLERAMGAAENARRQAKHVALVARVLPHKRPPSDPVH